MKDYSEYYLSELFSKIDDILQKYFGEKDIYSFYEKDDEDYKMDLSKRKYVMYLSNGDSFRVKLLKNSIPHLLGINTDYLKKTGLYKGDTNSYEVMLQFIRNHKGAYKKHKDGIIDLNQVISPYVEEKLDSVYNNLIITTNNCNMVCKYDARKTFGYGIESDKMSYLILQQKKDKYYVLKLGKSGEEGLFYPMSNQVYNTYDEFCEKFSVALFNQEITLLNGVKFSTGGYTYDNSFNIQPYERKPKLMQLKKLAVDLNCTPNVLHDYIYSIGVMNDKRNSNLEDSEILLKLGNCMMKKIPFDLTKECVVSEQLITLINNYNNSLFMENSLDANTKFSDMTKENTLLKQKLESTLEELEKANAENENISKQLSENKKLYTDADNKLKRIDKILNEDTPNKDSEEYVIKYRAK